MNVELLGTMVHYDENQQEIESLSYMEMDMQQPDYHLENVIAMIMQQSNVAFLPDVESFANVGQRLNGFIVNDMASLKFALDVLDHEIQNLPQDYIDHPDFAERKPCLYLITKHVGFRGKNVEWMDDKCKDGDGARLSPPCQDIQSPVGADIPCKARQYHILSPARSVTGKMG